MSSGVASVEVGQKGGGERGGRRVELGREGGTQVMHYPYTEVDSRKRREKVREGEVIS